MEVGDVMEMAQQKVTEHIIWMQALLAWYFTMLQFTNMWMKLYWQS
jgi:hypothetical protein